MIGFTIMILVGLFFGFSYAADFAAEKLLGLFALAPKQRGYQLARSLTVALVFAVLVAGVVSLFAALVTAA